MPKPSKRDQISPKMQLPADVDPWAIANDPALDHAAKVERLHQLEQDVRSVQVAQEEGMDGTTKYPPLADVRAALEQLSGGTEADPPHASKS